MGTPFINFIGPSKLDGFQRGAPAEAQPGTIPRTFLEAMEVREAVFVGEQNVPAENEFDADDPRCCHWVVYASVNKTEEAEIRDEQGNVVQPRRSSTRTTPIGTIRLVPFPHESHPDNGGEYWNGVLNGPRNGEVVPRNSKVPSVVPAKTFGIDRATTYHDGKEPYVKLGRLAVLKEFRGHRIAGLLVKTVLNWLKSNPTYFNPSIMELGLEQMGASNGKDVPKWNGLICVHAQKQVIGAWEKWGFEVDEGMGEWSEEGMAHVGMFQRVTVDSPPARV
ncbi:acyl-CoA N-acyltransferase [Ilyonectria sp. MPI-CAGE-AT-0026]|nr:acyl-CoA N-acyltransferase [Ilyonectria sp. MPI-CAGE-AT-0026]